MFSGLTANELDKIFGKGKWVPTNCFCLEQANKWRRIDNSRKSSRNRATRQTEKLIMNTAMATTLAARTIVRMVRKKPKTHAADRVLAKGIMIGGEDMPNAFRSIPIFQIT